jgi:hypothetical protein
MLPGESAPRRVRVTATGCDLGGITLSIGRAQHDWGEPAANLLRRADDALYRYSAEIGPPSSPAWQAPFPDHSSSFVDERLGASS